VALVPLLCVLDNSYQGYAVSGLENHLVIFCMLGALLCTLGRSPRRWLWTGLFLGLANLSRPDAGLLAGTFAISFGIGLIGVKGKDGSTRRQRAYVLAKTLAVWLAITGTWFLWRYWYYGLLLPNTFYLKVGDTFDGLDRGWEYTTTFFEDRYYLPLAALLALRWIRKPVMRWMLLFVICHIAWITYVGGDFYTGHRFYVALLPILYLLIAYSFNAVIETIQSRKAWKWLRRNPVAVASIVGAMGGAMGYGLLHFTARLMGRGPYNMEILRWGEAVNANIQYMRWLGTLAKPGQSMVLGDIGAAGFLADVSVVDALGVVDPNTSRMKVPGFGKGKPGHEKWASREYMLSKKPTYIKWGWIHGDLHPQGFYVFTDFPLGVEADGLWVREDLIDGRYLADTAIHFEPSELAFWNPSGDAFESFPTTLPIRGQLGVFGTMGSYLDTFTLSLGDKATGRLQSPPFPIVGDKMILRVGGGRDPVRLRVSLLVDGVQVRSATGHQREILGRRVWDITAFKGRQGRLEVIDQSQGNWGHLLVDEVVQWESRGAR
jgi:hypothetical protein